MCCCFGNTADGAVLYAAVVAVLCASAVVAVLLMEQFCVVALLW